MVASRVLFPWMSYMMRSSRYHVRGTFSHNLMAADGIHVFMTFIKAGHSSKL
jgi:hypothetical protein